MQARCRFPTPISPCAATGERARCSPPCFYLETSRDDVRAHPATAIRSGATRREPDQRTVLGRLCEPRTALPALRRLWPGHLPAVRALPVLSVVSTRLDGQRRPRRDLQLDGGPPAGQRAVRAAVCAGDR